MALVPTPLVEKIKPAGHLATSIFHFKPFIQSRRTMRMSCQCRMIARRAATSILAASVAVLAMEATCDERTANAFDFRITTPDQTLEQAESGIKGHAESLIKVKDLLKEESWEAAQRALRKSSAYLKKDIYTIIQAKPGSEGPVLRKLYSTLFNSVTRLDYAARDRDVPVIWNCYDKVVVALNDIMSRL